MILSSTDPCKSPDQKSRDDWDSSAYSGYITLAIKWSVAAMDYN
jgi:hypothetical protein